jgi:hypothetical protein
MRFGHGDGASWHAATANRVVMPAIEAHGADPRLW